MVKKNVRQIGSGAIICLLLLVMFIPTMGCVPHQQIASLMTDNDPIQPLFTKETFMIPMRDGINLATDVYLPDNITTLHGAILVRTPYNKNGTGLGAWTDKGYFGIVQDCRGRFQSEGIDTIFRNAHTDGYDTLAWIGDQNWSNGKVATIGGSATGIVQYLMAGTNPPELTCQHIGAATANFHKIAVYQGGQFRKQMIEGWLQNQGSTYILPELWAQENYSLQYWTNVSLEDNWQDINVPATHIGGWYDCFCQGIIDGFMGYQYQGGPGAAGKSKLIMGPWTHATWGTALQGELIYPSNAIDDFTEDYWTDMLSQYLLEESTAYENRPNVMYYVMGDVNDNTAPGNEWRYTDSWPPNYVEKEWYFHEDGTLTTTIPGSTTPITYTYDPSSPVPTKGGQNLFWPSGPFNQASVENRQDVLVFTTDTLTEPYEATGPIKARLYVSSDCPDTDFTVKLTDVYPNGKSMLICDGILRMRNRNGPDHWEFMQPDQIYEVEVDLWSTSYVWNTGHKIRVDVSSSNYPRFLANPNTMDGIMQNTGYNIATNTLYLDTTYPSCIILPEYTGNYAPLTPTITGTTKGAAGITYDYTVATNDPEGNSVWYYIDWGDNTNSDWQGPYPSGTPQNFSHTWNKKGIFTIKVKAKDSYNSESVWGSLIISMPKAQIYRPLWLQILTYLFNKIIDILAK
ncbi:MAG: CocE/NonD family hydrolase [Candidatus Thermoplasmatota archaeon]|nr:CocE/NonD family hydrolase [Candidatus Thermoplasmatota archaeon]MBU1941884.1 CocE/NonD family hydrolase [Candidatus Thermoplasmatota archaeon]